MAKDKKLISYSDPFRRDLCEGILADISAYKGISQSRVCENSIIHQNISTHEDVLIWVKDLYRQDEFRRSLTSLLSGLCEEYSAGINWNAAYANGLPLIKFILKIINNTSNFVCSTDDYINSKLDSIETKIRLSDNNSSDAIVIHNMIGKPFDKKQIISMISVLMDNWETLGNWQIPYRLLTVLLRDHISHTDTVNERLEYIALVNKLAESWR